MLLGFDKPLGANPNPATQKLRRGVPSESTLSRHRHRFGVERRDAAYAVLFDTSVISHFEQFPDEMREEARLLGIDGTKIETHYTCPIRDRATGKVVNAERVTCADGGYVGDAASPDKRGHGYNAMLLTTFTGLPLAFDIVPLHTGEPTTAAALLTRFKDTAGRYLDKNKIAVLAGDGAFSAREVRRTAREAGLVENIHGVSHGDSERSRRNAERANARRVLIDGYPNWFANGHAELHCKCGEGKTSKDVKARPGKMPTVRINGSCASCGPITITSGRWRKVQNAGRNGQLAYRRIQAGEEHEADYAFGNPLTFNDPIARVYGLKRFGYCEGFHGTMVSRFNLMKGKRWFRRIEQPRSEFSMIGAFVHLLAMEQRRLAKAGTTLAASASPPGPPGSP